MRAVACPLIHLPYGGKIATTDNQLAGEKPLVHHPLLYNSNRCQGRRDSGATGFSPRARANAIGRTD